MRLPIRSIATLLMAVGVATCSDSPTAPLRRSGTGASGTQTQRGRIAFQPTFSKTAQYAAQHSAEFGITYDSVHVVIRGLPDKTTIAKDTTVFFTPTSPSLTLNLDVDVAADGQMFDAVLDYTNNGQVVYHGETTVQSYPPGQTPPTPPTITIDYVGPGSTTSRIVVSPKSATLVSPQTLSLTVSAFDAAGNAVTSVPIFWTTSQPNLATIDSLSGLVHPRGVRGAVTVTAIAATGATDNATVAITLPPASIVLVSGSGQTGKVHSQLANPVVVQVNAEDGVGVAGVSVIFAAPAGGAVGSSSVTTDANGRASTTLTLGNVEGPEGFSATATGFSVGITGTATAGDPTAIAIVSGGSQRDTVQNTLAPLSVKVTDAFGNAVPGAVVTWTRTAGTGALASATTTTDAGGLATNNYTLGKAVGAETVTASVSGVSAMFSFTTVAGGATLISGTQGGNQTGAVGQALGTALIARVTDADGNPVSGAGVVWTATNGTASGGAVTDANGEVTATLILGMTPGAARATARLWPDGKFVNFLATAVAPPGPTQLLLSPDTSRTFTLASGGTATGLPTIKTADAAGVGVGNVAVQFVLTRQLNGNTVNVATSTVTSDPTGSIVLPTVPTATAGVYTVTVTSAAMPNAKLVFTIVLTTGSATQIVLTSQSATGMDRVPLGSFTVQLVDANGNHVAVAGLSVTPSVSSAPEGGTPLSGFNSVTTDSTGQATFGALTVAGPVGTYTLAFQATGFAPVQAQVSISAGAAAALKFVQQPVTIASNQTTPVSVAVVDADGNTVTTVPEMSVQLGILPSTNPAGATLTEFQAASTMSGIATFPSVGISLVGTGYQLQTTNSANLPNATSAPFDITPGPADHLSSARPGPR